MVSKRPVDMASLEAGDRAPFGDQILRHIAFEHANARRLAHRRDQRRHDVAPGLIAAHVHDAARRMRGLLPDQQMAFQILVERHAVFQQVADALRRLARHRIRQPPRRPVRRRPRWCRAHALPACRLRRPPQRPAPAPRRSTRLRRSAPAVTMVTGRGAKLQRAEQAREPAADDDDVIGRKRLNVSHGIQLFRWIIRSTERAPWRRSSGR
jgi:hypothetical protein